MPLRFQCDLPIVSTLILLSIMFHYDRQWTVFQGFFEYLPSYSQLQASI